MRWHTWQWTKQRHSRKQNHPAPYHTSERKTVSLKQSAAIFNINIQQEPFTLPCATSEVGTNIWITTEKGKTTQHNHASGTCTMSEIEHQDKNRNIPRACKKATALEGTPHHPIWHIGKTTDTAPIWWKNMQRPNSKHISYQGQMSEWAQSRDQPYVNASSEQTTSIPITNQHYGTQNTKIKGTHKKKHMGGHNQNRANDRSRFIIY